MSLSISVFLLHILADSGPLEMLHTEEKERKPLEPFRTTVHDGADNSLEEDIRWLMT